MYTIIALILILMSIWAIGDPYKVFIILIAAGLFAIAGEISKLSNTLKENNNTNAAKDLLTSIINKDNKK